MDNINSGTDLSQEPAFIRPRKGQAWFGPAYFRNKSGPSLPYMTISVRSGDKGPVIAAAVNLQFLRNFVSRTIGKRGKAYVVDGDGLLIADPDVGLVLRKTNLSELPHVKSAIENRDPAMPMTRSHSLDGTPVLVVVAPIDLLGWNVFVEQPVAEVDEEIYPAIARNGLLMLMGLVLSVLAALAVSRSIART
jgi:hypothetical protein